MATSEAATLLGWQGALGSVQAGKRADMLVVYGRSGDPYALLLEARETAICLVVIDGVARLGNERLMGYLGGGTERWRVASANRVLNLAQESADPVVGALTLSEARERLRNGLTRLPELARQMEQAALTSGAAAANPVWSLLLDHHEPENMALRHHLRFKREPTATRVSDLMRTLVPLSQLLGSLELDPLTASDDGKLLERLLGQRNLPPYVKADLSRLL
jgi:5-methylthioadenosine/S-adenosylhomocysteine deaminase